MGTQSNNQVKAIGVIFWFLICFNLFLGLIGIYPDNRHFSTAYPDKEYYLTDY